MACGERFRKGEKRILSNDDILDLVYLKRVDPIEYKQVLKDISEILRDIEEIRDEVNSGKKYRINLAGMNDTIPNVMLELDYMTDHLPNPTSIQMIKDVFDDNGINLTVFISDEITHVSPLNVWTDTDADVTNDFDNIKANFYGNNTMRGNATDQLTAVSITGLLTRTLTLSGIQVDTPPDQAIVTKPDASPVDQTQGWITIKSNVTTTNSVTLSVTAPAKPATTGSFSWFGNPSATVLPIPGTDHIVTVKIPFRSIGALTDAVLPSVDVTLTASADPGTVGADTHTNSPVMFTKMQKAYSQVVRYGIFGHDMLGGASGTAEYLGNDLVVTLGEGWGDIDLGHAGSEGTEEEQGGTLMHELGHGLGLRHGGPGTIKATDAPVPDADENCKPNYNSIMTYSRQTDVYTGAAWILDYSHGNMTSLIEAHLDESQGFRTTSTDNDRNPYKRSDGNIKKPFSSTIGDPAINVDFHKSGDKFETDVAVDINNLGIPGCNTPSIETTAYHDYDDWLNLQYNFRENGVSGQYDAATAFYPTTISDINTLFIDLAEIQGFVLDDPIMDPPPTPEGTDVKSGKTTPLKMVVKDPDGNVLEDIAVHGEFLRDDGQIFLVEDKNGNRFFNLDGNSGFYSLNWKVPRGYTGPAWVTIFISDKEGTDLEPAILDLPALPDDCFEPVDYSEPIEFGGACPTFKVNITR